MLRTLVPRIKGKSLPPSDRILKWKVVKGDEVVVTSGTDQGKKGKVLRVLRKRNLVIVQGINVTRRHVRRGSRGEFSKGYWYAEAPLAVARVAHLDPETMRPCRVHWGELEGKKVRLAPSGAVIPHPPPPTRTELRQRVGPKDTVSEEALRATFVPDTLNPLLDLSRLHRTVRRQDD